LKRPNILFIFSDQHSPFFFGHEGHPVQRTPNFDALSREGVVFGQAYCQNPLCVPSRASMMMGKYSRNIGLYENRHIMPSNYPTIPNLLGNAGYKTCVIGKTHINGEQFHGFSQRPYGDLFGQAHQPDPARNESEAGFGDIIGDAGPTGIPLAMTQTEICVAETVKWLQINRKSIEPFFLCVNFEKPHFPINPPKRFFDYYIDKVTLPVPPSDRTYEEAVPFVVRAAENNGMLRGHDADPEALRKTLAAYCGCVEWVDDAVGRIIDALDYMGLGEDTIVVYSTDHGEMAFQKGFWQKTVFFDGSARVPLIFRCPGRIAGGRRWDLPVGLIDLMPTFCAAAGAAAPEEGDGVDMSEYLLHGKKINRTEIYCESVVLKEPEHAGCMLRTDRWKYCFYLDGAEELYDMETDPMEDKNLIDYAVHATLVKSLREKVVEFWQPGEQIERYRSTPMMQREKHFYYYSNQFMTGDGSVVDAIP